MLNICTEKMRRDNRSLPPSGSQKDDEVDTIKKSIGK